MKNIATAAAAQMLKFNPFMFVSLQRILDWPHLERELAGKSKSPAREWKYSKALFRSVFNNTLLSTDPHQD
jgi:hypothetical protein